jgi:UDP-N-acetylglucosamine/UDP-N-acetylgalactosamine diphosphorylase
MWAVDERFERILLESPGSLFVGPDGHGGMLSAFKKSGCLADVQQRGIQHLFYGQIDNPLLQVCDELFLGSHALAGSEMTTQVVKKREALERVGNVVSIDGKTQVIEYSDLPDEFARQTNPDGSLRLWAGNLAVHVLNVDFLSRVASKKNALPFHYAKKKVRCIDAAGKVVDSEEPNAIRFERFIFDLLPLAQQALVVEADPAEAFAPVKNSDDEPTDNPKLAKAAMMAKDRRLLRAAGIEIGHDMPVEINPFWGFVAFRSANGRAFGELKPTLARFRWAPRARRRAFVDGSRADEAVVVELLDDVGGPADDAGDDEQRRVEIDR